MTRNFRFDVLVPYRMVLSCRGPDVCRQLRPLSLVELVLLKQSRRPRWLTLNVDVNVQL